MKKSKHKAKETPTPLRMYYGFRSNTKKNKRRKKFQIDTRYYARGS